jgi:hypothetical protein
MAEVFLNKKNNGFKWVVSTRTTINIINKDTMKSMKNKKFSRLVEISSTLQQLREVLLKKGHVLQELLEKPFPSADAVYSAVGEIHNWLERDDICDVWVSAHVKVDDGIKSISNRYVCKVSVLLIASLDCTEHACA